MKPDYEDAKFFVKTARNRHVLFLNMDHAIQFDKVIDAKKSGIDLYQAIDMFSNVSLGDAHVKIIYFQEKVHWDIVFQYNNESPKHYQIRKEFEYVLLLEGLVLEREINSDDSGQSFLKVLIPFEKLAKEAEFMNLKLTLKSKIYSNLKKRLIKSIRHSKFRSIFDRFRECDMEAEVNLLSTRFRMSKMHCFVGESIDLQTEARLSLFTTAQRNQVAYSIISRIKIPRDDNINYDLNMLIQDEVYTSYFSLHDGPLELPNDRSHLKKIWSGWIKTQPINEIRDYFGTRIALHFAWLGHYTFWLILASVPGLICFAFGIIISFHNYTAGTIPDFAIYSNVFDNQLTLPFAWIISVWGVFYVQFWNRRNRYLSAQWNVADFSRDEKPRPQWYGNTLKKSLINGKSEPHFERRRKIMLYFYSAAIMFVMLLISVCNVMLYVVYSAWVQSSFEKHLPQYKKFSNAVTSMISLFTITVLSAAGRTISEYLTNNENHKTNSDYQNALIAKYLGFDFVNYYGILIWIAIFKIWIQREKLKLFGTLEYTNYCIEGDCMFELTMQMTIIFIGRSIIHHVQNWFEPIFTSLKDALKTNQLSWFWTRISRETYLPNKRSSKLLTLSQVWQDSILTNVDLQNTEISGYNAATVQFGFIMLFSVSFPIAPFFAVLHNIIQRKIDAENLLARYKRPFAFRSQSIGVWANWMMFLAYLGVALNAFIISFTSNYFEKTYLRGYEQSGQWTARLLFMLVFEHSVLFTQLIVNVFLPRIPIKAVIVTKRQEYVERLLRSEELDEPLFHHKISDGSFPK